MDPSTARHGDRPMTITTTRPAGPAKGPGARRDPATSKDRIRSNHRGLHLPMDRRRRRPGLDPPVARVRGESLPVARRGQALRRYRGPGRDLAGGEPDRRRQGAAVPAECRPEGPRPGGVPGDECRAHALHLGGLRAAPRPVRRGLPDGASRPRPRGRGAGSLYDRGYPSRRIFAIYVARGRRRLPRLGRLAPGEPLDPGQFAEVLAMARADGHRPHDPSIVRRLLRRRRGRAHELPRG